MIENEGLSSIEPIYRLWVSAEEIEGFIRARLILREYESVLSGKDPTWMSSVDSIKRALKTLEDVIERGVGRKGSND